MSVLFCDLVGFTAASESLDPEDVATRLHRYHARVRATIERFGGIVEKFIGDAVMAVFGAPTAHEDDPERAIRAGLAVLTQIGSDPGSATFHVRIGIHTGEALVDLDARPTEGEAFVAGDVVNTAARIQAAAPVDGIAVSAATHLAAARSFTWQRLPDAAVKGKTSPLELWSPTGPVQLRGSSRRGGRLLVGRSTEVERLVEVLAGVRRSGAARLLTIVGEPGVGKSRLVAELAAGEPATGGDVIWRRGRCLPYGDGISFWALSDVVKAEFQILDTDDADTAKAKIKAGLGDDDSEASWIQARLLPLLGIASASRAPRDEAFTAWRTFLARIARRRAAVVLIEDIHWADDALLDFLEFTAVETTDAPLLLLCTTRPELLQRRPEWSRRVPNAELLRLEPLSEAATDQLIEALLEGAPLSNEVRREVLERAGGNPLYAEEFIRMLHDRGLIGARVAATAAIPVPPTLQALVASRLDTLPRDRKVVLQDGSVIGKTFWTGAVAALSEIDLDAVTSACDGLSAAELVRRLETSTIVDEREYGFWHAVIREVTYNQLPRPVRMVKHARAAAWLEATVGERAEHIAEVLAYHAGQALTLAQTLDDPLAADLVPVARRYAFLAGERSLGLDTAKAIRFLDRARELSAADDPLLPTILRRRAAAAQQAGDLVAAAALFQEAADLSTRLGDIEGAGEAQALLAAVQHYLGDGRFLANAERAVAMLAERPGPSLVEALSRLAGVLVATGRNRASIDAADRAIDVARACDLAVPARALGFRGAARANLGDRDGVDDLRRAYRLMIANGQGRDAVIAAFNLASTRWNFEGAGKVLDDLKGVIDLAESRGITEIAVSTAGALRQALVPAGQLQGAILGTDDILSRLDEMGEIIEAAATRAWLARAHAELGHLEAAREPAESSLASGRDADNPPLFAVAAGITAYVRLLHGSRAEAMDLLRELAADSALRSVDEYVGQLSVLTMCAIELGEVDLAAHLVSGASSDLPVPNAHLALARAQIDEAAGDDDAAVVGYAAIVDRWREFGENLALAYTLRGLGRTATRAGDARGPGASQESERLFATMRAPAVSP